MRTICTSLQTDNHTNTSSLNFYRPDAHSDAKALKAYLTNTLLTRIASSGAEKGDGGIVHMGLRHVVRARMFFDTK